MSERVWIFGSREWEDAALVVRAVESLPADCTVLVGGARGVDTIAEEQARLRGLTVKVYPADWKAYGKRAGVIRNLEMLADATSAIAFWDGRSRGTKHGIDIARGKIPLRVEGLDHTFQSRPQRNDAPTHLDGQTATARSEELFAQNPLERMR